MQPPVTHTGIPAREEDYRVRPAAEPKSWVSDQPVQALGADAAVWPDQGARLYTHNVEHFARPEAAVEMTEPDVEPTVSPPPHWMIMIAGAAVAALMGALLGGFMHI
jgi:hypothetical protein